jgi:hypothetical protein
VSKGNDLQNLANILTQGALKDPSTIQSTDRGSSTRYRFAYQNILTAIICIRIYTGEIRYKEIYCEHHEDILARTEDDAFIGIQIKTKDSKLAPFKLKEKGISDSFARFVILDIQFKFQSFLLVSNHKFDQEVHDFLDNLKKDKINDKEKDYIKWLQTKKKMKGYELFDIIKALCKVKLSCGPALENAYSLIVDVHLACIERCKKLSLERNKKICDNLIQKIDYASNEIIHNPLQDYFIFQGSSTEDINLIGISKKRITKEIISQILEEKEIQLLKSKLFNTVDPAMPNLIRKFQDGGIDRYEALNMVDLGFSADSYLFEKYYVEGDEIPSEVQHIRVILRNQATEARVQTKSDRLFGEAMLNNLYSRLEKIRVSDQLKQLDLPYEVLKGTIANLTEECFISFSN